jgi:hypothetical protein
MDAWSRLYATIEKAVASAGSNAIYFRGHSSSDWPLLPSLARVDQALVQQFSTIESLEEHLYFSFVTGAGELISTNDDSWSNLFTMQHHGLPTRLLDWTESFAIALFFAIRGEPTAPALWMLDPYDLNTPTFGRPWVPDLADLEFPYLDYFVTKKRTFR